MTRTLLFLVLLVSPACALDSVDPDSPERHRRGGHELGDHRHARVYLRFVRLQDSTISFLRDCFITNIKGGLSTGGGVWASKQRSTGPSIDQGWYLHIDTVTSALWASAACVNGVTVASRGTWTPRSIAVDLGIAAAPNWRVCGLTSVKNTSGFASPSDYVTVGRVASTGRWSLGGYQHTGASLEVKAADRWDEPAVYGPFAQSSLNGEASQTTPLFGTEHACALTQDPGRSQRRDEPGPNLVRRHRKQVEAEDRNCVLRPCCIASTDRPGPPPT